MKGTKHGQMIANQMLDVAIRVQAIRPFTVTQMVRSMYEGCHGEFGYRRILARAATFVFSLRCGCQERDMLCELQMQGAVMRVAGRFRHPLILIVCRTMLQSLLLENVQALASNSQRNGICEVLYAAAWICGEFAQ